MTAYKLPILLLTMASTAVAQLPRITFSGDFRYPNGGFEGNARFQFPMPGMRLMVNAPFSGQEQHLGSQTLADGTHIARPATAEQKVWRDSQGRIRIEHCFVSGPTANRHVPTLVEILDPVAGYIYVMDDFTRVVHRIKSSATPQPNMEAVLLRAVGRGANSTEDLGSQMISGVMAHGTRTTNVIPAGSRGNSGPITSTRDTWYSPELNMIIQTVTNDPRAGNSVEGVGSLTRDEPDPALFGVPMDYKLVDETGTFEIKWGR